ncbi:MAG: Cdc6/Cdc18 family protein [Candidatus Thorarchaeota archaeon]
MIQSIRQLMEDELDNSNLNYSLFKNENVLTFDYMPENLPHREKQIIEMTRYLKGIFLLNDSNSSFRQSIILVGSVGTGKTSAAKRLGQDFESISEKKMKNIQFIYRHLNCRRSRTVYLLLIELMKSLSPNFPHRGFSASELIYELLATLESLNLYLLLTLDEIDYLFKDSEINTLLYTFTRINDESNFFSINRISLIVITRNQEFLYLLDSSTKSSLAKNIVIFPSYTQDELTDILQKRLSLGVKEDVFPMTLVKSIAKFAADKGGDARLAIEILWRSIKIAENSFSKEIRAEHVRTAQQTADPVNKEIIEDLPLQFKVALLSIGRLLHQNPNKNKISLTMVKKQFLQECRKLKLDIGKGHTSLWSYIQKLCDLGLIQTSVENKNTKGRVTVIEMDIPTDSLINIIEKAIKVQKNDKDV